MPRPNIPHVAPGELIDAAWGNAVVDRSEWDAVAMIDGARTRYGVLVQSMTQIATTSVNGAIMVAYPIPYFNGDMKPAVFIDIFAADQQSTCNVFEINYNTFQAILKRTTDGQPIPNYGFAFQWMSIGPRHPDG